MVPFSSIYQEGVPSGAHSTRQGLLALTSRLFRLVLRNALEACLKVKAINTFRNEQSSLFKWTILYQIDSPAYIIADQCKRRVGSIPVEKHSTN